MLRLPDAWEYLVECVRTDAPFAHDEDLRARVLAVTEARDEPILTREALEAFEA